MQLELKEKKNQKYSIQSLVANAEQMLSRIEYLHKNGYVHRDIKPENFLFGLNKNKNTIYIIDFGLTKRYRDPKTKNHIPYKDNLPMNGTVRYASINTHLGIQQTRRDDLETWIYCLVYLGRGDVPWQNPKKGDTIKEKYDIIMQRKMELTPEFVCKGLPSNL